MMVFCIVGTSSSDIDAGSADSALGMLTRLFTAYGSHGKLSAKARLLLARQPGIWKWIIVLHRGSLLLGGLEGFFFGYGFLNVLIRFICIAAIMGF